MLVFTYGSLRKGYGNHPLLDGSRFVATAKTLPAYTMIHLGGFPGIIYGGETEIIGELYEVDARTLATLDQLEGHPGFYERQSIKVYDAEGTEYNTYCYLLPEIWLEDAPYLIKSGDWSNR